MDITGALVEEIDAVFRGTVPRIMFQRKPNQTDQKTG